jgi:hypothetical protein
MSEQSVPHGVPASGAGPVADLIAADPPPAIRSVYSDLLDQALAAPRVHTTKVEQWVEDGSRAGGHWEIVS